MVILNVLFLAVGIYVLVKGADFLIDGSTNLAKKFGISTLIIGLTIVAFGTSLPELMVNITGALKGSTGIALGNIIGSNIANLLLVLGIIALFKDIHVKKSVIHKEIPFSIFSVVLLLIVINSKILAGEGIFLSRPNGSVLVLFFILFSIFLFKSAKSHEIKHLNENLEERNNIKIKSNLLLILAGMVGLYFGGEWAVGNAIILSQLIGLSEFAISASVIAVGTSLPELVTSLRAIKKKQVDLAVGNIVGSNIFNILWVLGLTSAIRPILITEFINLDLVILFFINLFVLMSLILKQKQIIDKKLGIVYLSIYLLYMIFIFVRF